MARPGTWAPNPDFQLPTAIIDNHCHLDFPAGDSPFSVRERIDAAAAAGVKYLVQVGCEVESAEWTAAVVEEYPELLGAIALHPNEAARLKVAGDYDAAFSKITELAKGKRIRAIGETGLDYFRTDVPGHAAQQQSFRDHIALAKELNLPLQIHDRDAHADVLQILREDGAPPVTIFHCFSGDKEMATECVAAGYYLSFAGTVTFSSATQLREALHVTPLSHLLIETDAPFLTPVPNRGRPNHPALAAHTARFIAQELETDLSELCNQVFDNSLKIYGPW